MTGIAARLRWCTLAGVSSSSPRSPPPAVAGESSPPLPPLADQVAAAVLAAPAEKRAAARVLAYDAEGALVEARKGTGDLVCLAGDPKRSGFSAACYHPELEPYMARGRALPAERLDGHENRKRRWAEIEARELAMPEAPRMLYVLHGEGYDPKKGEVAQPFLRWVIFTPYATPGRPGSRSRPLPGPRG